MLLAGDPFAFRGKCILEQHHATLLAQHPTSEVHFQASLPNPFDISDDVLRFSPHLKVGVLGAGVGGLYTGLVLDSLGIEYDILESTDRVGGRFLTHKFPGGDEYDYYEAGAMRFPFPKKDPNGRYKDGTMKRLAELIEYGPLNEGRDPLKDKLIPYYYDVREGSEPGFYYFNGILEDVSSNPKGSFDAEAMNVPPEYIQAGADAINSDITDPFIKALVQDIQTNQTTGYNMLKENDLYSVRGYMATKYLPSHSLKLPLQHLPNNVINWCALLGGSSSGWDRALIEWVFESMTFARVGGADYGDVEWKSFKGGAETLSKKMEEYIRKKGGSIEFQKRVTAIGRGEMVVSLPETFSRDAGVKETLSESVDNLIEENRSGTEQLLDAPHPDQVRVEIPCVTVTVNGIETRNYSHVISTLPLPVLRIIDLKDAGLNVMQKNALRTLEYGPSVKIAVLFKSNWWTTKLGIVGGQSYTDLPIHTIVYPSHGVDSDRPCKVLVASYSWTTDAFRLSALASAEQHENLKELVLRNLAEAHGARNPEITYTFLKEQYVDMHIKDWNQDPHAMGAFAFFGPGQFEDLYVSLNFPAANNRLHFAGEAVSTRHAWVTGALDSAWKAVYQYLKLTGQDEKIKKFKEIWGENIEWTSKTTLVDPDQDGPDMLDRHLSLVSNAIRGGVASGQGV